MCFSFQPSGPVKPRNTSLWRSPSQTTTTTMMTMSSTWTTTTRATSPPQNSTAWVSNRAMSRTVPGYGCAGCGAIAFESAALSRFWSLFSFFLVLSCCTCPNLLIPRPQRTLTASTGRRPTGSRATTTTVSFDFNCQPLEVVSRYRDPQLQVASNYWYLFNLALKTCKSWCLTLSSLNLS